MVALQQGLNTEQTATIAGLLSLPTSKMYSAADLYAQLTIQRGQWTEEVTVEKKSAALVGNYAELSTDQLQSMRDDLKMQNDARGFGQALNRMISVEEGGYTVFYEVPRVESVSAFVCFILFSCARRLCRRVLHAYRHLDASHEPLYRLRRPAKNG